MKRRLFVCACLAPLLLFAQSPKPQFFAGVVIEYDSEHLKVSRSLVGHPAETHIFALDSKTKISKGGIKVKSRVTVRYEHSDDRDLALEIQVRPPKSAPKPPKLRLQSRQDGNQPFTGKNLFR